MELSRNQKIALAVIAVPLIYACGRLLVSLDDGRQVESPGGSFDAVSSSFGGAEGGKAAPQPAAELVVDVSGAVRRPGVYRLKAGSRVGEAIDAAGGAEAKADLALLNRAAPLSDGEKVTVPLQQPLVPLSQSGLAGASPPIAGTDQPGGAPGGTGGGGTGAGGKVNLNAADAVALDTLDGVGPATAERILRYREEQGPFKSIEQLKEVEGIGEKKFERLKDQVTI